ncbi:MAG: hypothetical protein IPO04_16730 [Cytophagaceae bacterium]|nr:hypothetical protein [Cytophagaceae bacterium]
MSKIKKIKTIINGLDDAKKMEKTSDKSKNGYLEFKRRGQSKSNRLKEIEEKNKIAEKKKIEEIRINNIIEKAVKNISIKMEFEHKRK